MRIVAAPVSSPRVPPGDRTAMEESPDRSPFPEPPRALPRFLDEGGPSPLRFFAKGTNARGRRGRADMTCEERRGVTHAACATREDMLFYPPSERARPRAPDALETTRNHEVD